MDSLDKQKEKKLLKSKENFRRVGLMELKLLEKGKLVNGMEIFLFSTRTGPNSCKKIYKIEENTIME